MGEKPYNDHHSIRVKEKLWNRILANGRKRGLSPSAVIIDAVSGFLDDAEEEAKKKKRGHEEQVT